MALSLKQGEIVVYPYLWRWQAERGETEGRKDRPVCVALPLQQDGVTHLFLLAITSAPPNKDIAALSIPDIEKRRAGLTAWKAGWVMIDECNYDIAERSFYIDTACAPIGRFSEAFTEQIKAAMRAALGQPDFNRIDRT